jgi:hypothetical protein
LHNKDEFENEKNEILSSLKRRALKLVDSLNEVEGVKCNKAEGK